MSQPEKRKTIPSPKDLKNRLLLWLGAALILRLVLALLPAGFWIDIGTFKAWTVSLAQKGPGNFYGGMWCDYPPIYLYFLAFWGKLYQLLFDPAFSATNGQLFTFWLKVPPILADILASYLIYALLKGRVARRSAYHAALFYAFNPLIIFVSAVWGQMDSVLIAVLIGIAWFLLEDRLVPAALLTTVAVLIKPQGLFILPLILFTQWFRQRPWKWVVAGFSSLALAWVLIWPMTPDRSLGLSMLWRPFFFLFEKMQATAATYPYSTVNAFNVWAMVGNWKPDSRLMLGLPHRIWGLLFLVALGIGVGAYLYKSLGKNRNFSFFLGASLLFMGCFLLPTRMHERYMLPALAFLAIAAGINRNLKKIYWGFTLTSLLNVAWVFFYYLTMKETNSWFAPINAFVDSGGRTIIVLANMWLFGDLMGYMAGRSPNEVEEPKPNPLFERIKKIPLPRFDKAEPWGKRDWQILFGIALLFFLIGLWRLGIPNEKIFDEVYHARTALEYIKGLNPYEWTHPPLAKLIVAVGIMIFGNNGFGWRIMSLLFGAFSLMLFYALAHKTFGSRRLASIAAALLALDGVFFVQSRVAMTNIYVVFFILLASLGLISYLKDPKDRFLWLIGVGLGGALASRWSAMYAWGTIMAMVAAFWFVVLRPQWSLGKSAFWMLRCLVYFLGIPFVLYAMSYIPYLLQGHNWGEVFVMQKNMWGYHANMHATHTYASPWYQWPFMIRPTWYYFHDWKNGLISGIDCIGNPAIWWLGIPAIGTLGYWISRKFSWNALFVVALALGLYLPWGIQPRSLVFMHYMFEATPFMVLAIAFILDWLWERERKIALSYLVVAFALFLFFYPMLSALPVSWEFYRLHIWLPSWV